MREWGREDERERGGRVRESGGERMRKSERERGEGGTERCMRECVRKREGG
jgi:hypothetical protein